MLSGVFWTIRSLQAGSATPPRPERALNTAISFFWIEFRQFIPRPSISAALPDQNEGAKENAFGTYRRTRVRPNAPGIFRRLRWRRALAVMGQTWVERHSSALSPLVAWPALADVEYGHHGRCPGRCLRADFQDRATRLYAVSLRRLAGLGIHQLFHYGSRNSLHRSRVLYQADTIALFGLRLSVYVEQDNYLCP